MQENIKLIKLILKTFIAVIVVLGLTACYLAYLSPSAFQARRNVENSKRIKIGMSKTEVLKIMGEPQDRRVYALKPTDSVYFYMPPFAASSGINIYFNQFDATNRIEYFE
jgi:hypothetical protein